MSYVYTVRTLTRLKIHNISLEEQVSTYVLTYEKIYEYVCNSNLMFGRAYARLTEFH